MDEPVGFDGDELVQFGQQVEMLARKVFAAQVRIADEIDGQSLASQRGYSSTSALLREVLRISPADASTRVKPRPPCRGTCPPVVRRRRCGRCWARRSTPAPLNPDGDLAEEDCQARAEFSIGSRNPGTGLTPISGKLDDRSVEQLRQAIDALSKPTPGADGVADARPAANRRALGLAMLAAWFLRSGDGPVTGGEPPRVVITIDWDLLHAQLGGSAVTDSGLPLSPAQVRRMLCDAEVLPAVLGSDGQVLDLGRTVRLFPPAIRRAIALRDRGCAFPGCDRPPAWCDAHHVQWWQRDLGPTSYRNGCLLCPFHKSLIHRGEWTVTMEDGQPTFWPPPWIDPQRKPSRNNLHDLDRLRG